MTSCAEAGPDRSRGLQQGNVCRRAHNAQWITARNTVTLEGWLQRARLIRLEVRQRKHRAARDMLREGYLQIKLTSTSFNTCECQPL